MIRFRTLSFDVKVFLDWNLIQDFYYRDIYRNHGIKGSDIALFRS